MGFPRTAAPRHVAGFTLIEVMITVAIIAILAAIALPSYQTFVMRSKIIGATSRLGDLRTQMEKFFMDNRTYLNGILCGAQPSITAYNADPASDFTITCPAPTATTYTLQAVGRAARGMANFTYTVDEANNKVTTNVPVGLGWAGVGATCWVTRKDGSC